MCNIAVPAIHLHRYKRNWPIICDLPEIWTVLSGAFHFFCRVYFMIIPVLKHKVIWLTNKTFDDYHSIEAVSSLVLKTMVI